MDADVWRNNMQRCVHFEDAIKISENHFSLVEIDMLQKVSTKHTIGRRVEQRQGLATIMPEYGSFEF